MHTDKTPALTKFKFNFTCPCIKAVFNKLFHQVSRALDDFAHRSGQRIAAHIKVNSGMNRFGFPWRTASEWAPELARLTGTMPIPPKWALGYHQCRYSYYPESRAREIAKGFRDRKIPCDVIWYDIDYMEAFRVFTFDRGHFPDPKKLNADLLAMGFHNVWMIDPGVKSRAERGKDDRPQADLDKEPQTARDARAKELAKFDAIFQTKTPVSWWSSISSPCGPAWCCEASARRTRYRSSRAAGARDFQRDRKSTRLNSSH